MKRLDEPHKTSLKVPQQNNEIPSKLMKKDAILLPTYSYLFYFYKQNINQRDANIIMWKYN